MLSYYNAWDFVLEWCIGHRDDARGPACPRPARIRHARPRRRPVLLAVGGRARTGERNSVAGSQSGYPGRTSQASLKCGHFLSGRSRPDHSGRSGTEPGFFHRPGVACGAWRVLTCDSQDLPYRKRFADPPAAPIYAGWAYRIQIPAASSMPGFCGRSRSGASATG